MKMKMPLWLGLVALGLAVGATPAHAQRAAAQTRSNIEDLLSRTEQDAGRAFDPAYRKAAAHALARLSAEELQARMDLGTMGVLSLGQTDSNLVYTPVKPCRIAATQLAGGKIVPGTPREFRVAGIALQAQGGELLGCGVPVGPATSAVINFTAIGPTGAGTLRAWAYSTPPQGPPNATLMSFDTVSAAQGLANAVTVPLCDASTTQCPFDLRLSADYASVDVVAEVMGYFSRFPVEQGAVPVGAILDYGGATAPAGYLLCDGATVSRTAYPDLFAAIGTAFGRGDGVTTFHLPDFRGRFARGRDGGAPLPFRDPERTSRFTQTGGNTGDAVGSLQVDAYRTHTHFMSWGHNFAGWPLGGPNNDLSLNGSDTAHSTGASGGTETRPVNVYVNKIIKY